MAKGKPIYAYFGTDEARIKEEALKRARELTPPENPEFGLEIVNGNADASDHAAKIVGETIAALQTLPFFGGDKVVWLQSINFMGDNVIGKAGATVSAIEHLGKVLEAGLAPGVTLIMSGTGIDKRRTLYKQLGKLGEVTLLDLPDPSRPGWEEEVKNLARKSARQMNFRFSEDSLQLFVMATGENTMQMQAEVEKLGIYLNGSPDALPEATMEDVRQTVAVTRAGVIFEIGDALASRNLAKTIELIDYQLRRGENPIGILLAAIIPRVRNLLLARDLYENHRISAGAGYQAYQKALERLPEHMTGHLPKKKEGGISAFPVFLAAKECGKFTLEELITGMRACLEANRRLVTTAMEPDVVLSQMVTRILTRVKRTAPS